MWNYDKSDGCKNMAVLDVAHKVNAANRRSFRHTFGKDNRKHFDK